jgi:D-3-phosphoglycerate dehydrogenase
MKDVVLYLDKLSPELEKVLIEMSPKDLDLRFLQPNIGKKGEIADATIFFDTIYQVTKDVIDAAPNLRLIQRTGVGVDMIDVDYAKKKSIPISISAGCNSVSVAELTIALILALYRHIVQLDISTKKGLWEDWTYRHDSFEIEGKTIGILGAGVIGRHVIQRVKAFGAKVLYYDVVRMKPEEEVERGIQFVGFEELIANSDIISIHMPLLKETKGMIGEKQFSAMKKNAILINTARGPIVDQTALFNALKNKVIAGAASDVYEKMPADSDTQLFELDRDINFIAVPHIGAATYDTYVRVFKLCLENVRRLKVGKEPLFLI